jgi:hypothetical protein
VAEPRAFLPGGVFDDHTIAADNCRPCWSTYPKPCTRADCSGLVHAVFGDYVGSFDDEGYYLETSCDVCGEVE